MKNNYLSILLSIFVAMIGLGLTSCDIFGGDIGEDYQTPIENYKLDENNMGYVENQVILIGKDEVTQEDISGLIEKDGGGIVSSKSEFYTYLIEYSKSYDKSKLQGLCKSYKKSELIVNCVVNIAGKTTDNSITDSDFLGMGSQNENDSKSYANQQWGYKEINMDKAKTAFSSSFNNVTAGVYDVAFMENHNDLDGVIQEGLNWEDNDYSCKDCEHGTHVSGIIGALNDNGFGIDGVNPNIGIIGSVTPGKAASGQGWFDSWQLFSVVSKSVLGGAKFINMSLGISFNSEPDENDYSYIKNSSNDIWTLISQILNKYDFSIIKAAGNDSIDAKFDYLSAINDKSACDKYEKCIYNHLIVVGATKSNFTFDSRYSNYGDKVDILAPGTDIISTIPKNGESSYTKLSGTSMAAPQVTGVASILQGLSNEFSCSKIKNILIHSTTKSISYKNKKYPFLNAYNSIASSGGVSVTIPNVGDNDSNSDSNNTGYYLEKDRLYGDWSDEQGTVFTLGESGDYHISLTSSYFDESVPLFNGTYSMEDIDSSNRYKVNFDKSILGWMTKGYNLINEQISFYIIPQSEDKIILKEIFTVSGKKHSVSMKLKRIV
jgi:subtilisin family serine protease